MSRLTDLLQQLRAENPQLGSDLESEITALTKRRSFGLVFERHQPEAVELPGIPPRKGAKVRILPARGVLKKGDQRLWLVESLHHTGDSPVAHLVELYTNEPEERDVSVDNLVVVAEFKDGIYPGLIETGRVEKGGDKPFHTVINAENFHALEMLTYTHRGTIDAIYIDPPYNSGAKDWKYNNDYVGDDDAYRHSKWLAMMERRLLIAKELLNPEDSVLIVTIDEKEYLRLGMLLEQTFPEARIQMVSSFINPKGVARSSAFRRADEFLYFVMFGESAPRRLVLGPEWEYAEDEDRKKKEPRNPEWTSMMRRGSNSARSDRPSLFYPIYVNPESRCIEHIGTALPSEAHTAPKIKGLIASLPLRGNGTEGRWQVGPGELKSRIQQGRVRVGRKTAYGYVINYLPDGAYADVLSDQFTIEGRAADGSLIAHRSDNKRAQIPFTQWRISSHNSSEYGSTLLQSYLPGRRFPFPKSLYAVEDTLRFFVKDKPNAVILDFFAGSGTTAHAVMRLNKQDDGRRQCISVTNNEVAAEEQRQLRKKRLRPGDPEWEQWGICDYVTKPRIQAAITGLTPDGKEIEDDYKFTDKFPMSDGFKENAAFFTLTHESPALVRHNRAFTKIAPMLWLRAGAQGRIITDLGHNGWDLADSYGVIEDFNYISEFIDALKSAESVQTVYLVTDDDSAYQMACRDLPEGISPVRLYSTYLENFEINKGRS